MEELLVFLIQEGLGGWLLGVIVIMNVMVFPAVAYFFLAWRIEQAINRLEKTVKALIVVSEDVELDEFLAEEGD